MLVKTVLCSGESGGPVTLPRGCLLMVNGEGGISVPQGLCSSTCLCITLLPISPHFMVLFIFETS